MPAREIFLRWAVASALFWMGGCSSSHGPDPAPIDPEWLEAERARVRAEREAELAQEAELAELERAVQAIESEGGEPPRPLEEAEVSQLLLYYCGDCHAAELERPSYDGMLGIEDIALMIEIGKIMPGDGEGSRLVVRMRMSDGRMPPVNADNAADAGAEHRAHRRVHRRAAGAAGGAVIFSRVIQRAGAAIDAVEVPSAPDMLAA